jgi:hypothetical protein
MWRKREHGKTLSVLSQMTRPTVGEGNHLMARLGHLQNCRAWVPVLSVCLEITRLRSAMCSLNAPGGRAVGLGWFSLCRCLPFLSPLPGFNFCRSEISCGQDWAKIRVRQGCLPWEAFVEKCFLCPSSRSHSSPGGPPSTYRASNDWSGPSHLFCLPFHSLEPLG